MNTADLREEDSFLLFRMFGLQSSDEDEGNGGLYYPPAGAVTD